MTKRKVALKAAQEAEAARPMPILRVGDDVELHDQGAEPVQGKLNSLSPDRSMATIEIAPNRIAYGVQVVDEIPPSGSYIFGA